MAINFLEEAFVDALALHGEESTKPAGVSHSKNVTGIEVRLSKAFIIDNRTPKIPPFPGYAKMYLIIIVVSDKGEVLQNLDLRSFAKVGDNEDLPIDKTIYYWKQHNKDEESPSQIHVFASVLKSKKSLRDVAKVMADVKNDSEFAGIVSSLKDVVKSASSVTQVSNMIFSIAGVVGKFLGKVEDKPLLTWIQSFTDINGDFDKLGIRTIEKGNRNGIFNLSLVIRDTTREMEVMKLHDGVAEELDLLDD